MQGKVELQWVEALIDVAKYKGLVTWSFGAYRGDGLLRHKFEHCQLDGGESIDNAESTRYADRDFTITDSVGSFCHFVGQPDPDLVAGCF